MVTEEPAECGLWVRSELLPTGVYGVGISVGEDRAWVLDRTRAIAYAAACVAAATTAEHDCAVYGLLVDRMGLDESTAGAFVLQDLLPNRPTANDMATAPVRFVGAIGRRRSGKRERVALLHMHLDEAKVGELTPADLRGHGQAVLTTIAAADLDAALHRSLRQFGLEDQFARAVVSDLPQHWPAREERSTHGR